MKTYLDINYSNSQSLDIYTNGITATKKTVLIHIHGGAWCYGNKSDSKQHGIFFAKNGFVTVCINYRLYQADTNTFQHPTQIKDCASAFAWVYKNIEKYGGNKNKIFISGHSSGGHLASLLAADRKYLAAHKIDTKSTRGVIAVDTAAFNLNAYNYVGELANKQMHEMRDIVYKVFSQDQKELLNASPIKYISEETGAKFLIIVSSNRPLAKKVSSNFVKRLRHFGKEATLLETDICDHDKVNKAMHTPQSEVAQAILKFLNS